jgi:hypothetical protein
MNEVKDDWVRLGDSWSLWPVVALRSAGFPAKDVLCASADQDEVFPEIENVSRALSEIVQDDRFREALLWQNPKMVDNWLQEFDAAAELRRQPSDTRRRLSTLARYLQRYATKNDTVGFFGPVGWATVDSLFAGAFVQKGDGAEVHRRSYFEPWSIEVLARLWEQDLELRQHLRPVLSSAARLDDGTLVLPRKADVPLTSSERAVAELCDGTASAAEIAQRLGRSFEDISGTLSRLVSQDAVVWGLHVPFGEHMDAGLADLLESLPPSGARDRCIAELKRLRAHHDEVDRAAGDVARLRLALRALGECFEKISGAPAVAGKHERFDSRNLLWCDTLADWDVMVGKAGIESLAAPLSLVLDVCRWLTWRLADGIGRKAAELVRENGGSVRFDEMLELIRPETTGKPGCVLEGIVEHLQDVVDRLIPRPGNESRLQISAADLQAAWAEAFAAPGPGWSTARMHNPDIMLATRDLGSVDGGDFQWVLGEVHVAINPLDFRMFVLNQRTPGLIERLLDETITGPRYLPAFSKQWGRLTPRSYPPPAVSLSGKDVYWTVWSDDLIGPEERRVRGVDLQVVERDGVATVVGDDGEIDAPFTEVIGEFLTLLSVSSFQPFRQLPHSPRVTVDRLVVQRETWRLATDDLVRGLPKQHKPRELSRRLRDNGIPRFSFVKLPAEPKPVFCDLRSEPLVHNILRLLENDRNAGGPAVFSEMLPGFDDLWLTDSSGLRRTSEFRFIAVDGLQPGGVK